jgi:hypothetical protein
MGYFMNRIAIILRKNRNSNLFRQLILFSFSCSKINEVLLCSGFFQERVNFSASGQILSQLQQNFPQHKNIIVVGPYNRFWKPQHDVFINQIMQIPQFIIQERTIIGSQWHAKVFIGMQSTNPRIAIIGSSNYTSRAFGINLPFNNECDVVMWDEKDTEFNNYIGDIFGPVDDHFEFLVAKYDDTDRWNFHINNSI